MAAHKGGNFLGGLNDDFEVGAFDVAALVDFDGSNLYDVVAEDVEAGCLGVEEYHIFGIDNTDEVLQVAVAVVVHEEVGGRDGTASQLPHEVAGGGVLGDDLKVIEQAGPGDEAGLVGDDVEM